MSLSLKQDDLDLFDEVQTPSMLKFCFPSQLLIQCKCSSAGSSEASNPNPFTGIDLGRGQLRPLAVQRPRHTHPVPSLDRVISVADIGRPKLTSPPSSKASAKTTHDTWHSHTTRQQQKGTNMPSKGVQVYTYIAAGGCSIELSVPGQTVVKDQLHQFWNGDLEVESSKIDNFFDKTGRFVFKVLHEGRVITEQWVEVNALTGSVGEGTMTTIANTHSVIHPEPRIIVSYGFYESGHGHDILPNRHQCYITVTPDYSDWLGQVAPIGSPQRDQPFRRLVLPAAHDVGMNSMQNCATILKHAGGAVVRTLVANEEKYTQVLAELADKLSGPAVSLIAPNIVSSLAITQKDPLPTMLALGARYFEFRPAHCHHQVRQHLPDTLYFQHSAIPGMAYDEFLTEVVRFLVDHPTEIIVVQVRPIHCTTHSDPCHMLETNRTWY